MDLSSDLPTGVDAAWKGLDLPPASWRYLVLMQIANFAPLRRHLGKVRADRLSDSIAARIDALMKPSRKASAGRLVIEVELFGRSLGDADDVLDRIATAFRDPIDIDGELCRIELILAAAAAPVEGWVDDVRLAEEAEAALTLALTERRHVVRDVTIISLLFDERSAYRELSQAVEREEVFLEYQPKFHVRRQEVTSAEALIRWQHPTRGLILPNDFIPLAEQSHLIGPLTLWTLRRVIADQRVLLADGHDLTIFVNISGQLLGNRHFIDTACAMVVESGVRIGFEITETSMIRDPNSAVEHLTIAAATGIPIAIDDYGTGLSSLAYLKRLPATELKIDKMFVLDLTSSHRDPLIVRSTIDLAHAMEMEVTAEGVETPAALALLSVMGCDQVQGYLLSRPLSLQAFRLYMGEGNFTTTNPFSFSLKRADRFWRAA